MIGQLQEHPLAELLQEISETGLSGALRLEQERLKTVVYLADGEPIYVTSNLRLHRLAECVRRWQALAAEQLAQLPASLSDLEFAAALLKEQLLSREQLDALQARQAAEMLRPALLWTEGTWEFDARVRIAQAMRVSVEMKRLLLEGARRLPPDFTAARISDLNEKLSPPMNAPEANLELLPKEAFVLSRLDAPLTVAELLSISTLPEEGTRHIVYTLALGGLVTRERPSRAFSAEMLERARSVKAPSQSATPAPAPKQEQSPARSPSAPAEVAAPANVKAEAVEEFGLDAFFARLDRATNHYEALGVRRSAPPGEIKSSYHKLAKRFHPDRFHKDADAALRARIEAAFARVAQAYETLKEKQSRATYDLKLSQTSASVQPQQQQSASASNEKAQPQASGSLPRQPEATEAEGASATRSRAAAESFGRGLVALRQSKPTAAIVSFAEAARLVPTDARYRAYYGRALAENESTRRQAENELKVAIALDSGNAGYRVMLAEVYALIGLPRRAQSELERALALDSKNTAARELLNTLQAAKG
jgi:curved DNA-binding protein CbpA